MDRMDSPKIFGAYTIKRLAAPLKDIAYNVGGSHSTFEDTIESRHYFAYERNKRSFIEDRFVEIAFDMLLPDGQLDSYLSLLRLKSVKRGRILLEQATINSTARAF